MFQKDAFQNNSFQTEQETPPEPPTPPEVPRKIYKKYGWGYKRLGWY